MADDKIINLAEKIRPMESNERATATSVISEDDNNIMHKDDIDMMPKDTKVSRRTADIPNLPSEPETASLAAKRVPDTETDDNSYINVGGMGSVLCTSKKELLQKLNAGGPSGSFGYIVGQTCKPIKGEYVENTHFDTVRELLNVPDKRRVSLCKDKETGETFVRKQIIKRTWNKNEAIVPLNMDHDNIAQIIGILQRDYGLNVWLELLFENAGLSLECFVKQKYPLSKIEFLEVSSGVLEGLSYLHLHKIIHHDIKPQNICVAEKGKLHVKLIDFGSARLPHQKVTIKDWTPEYIAPECCKYYLSQNSHDAAVITTKADVFSFSMVCGYIQTKSHLLVALLAADGKGNKDNRIAVIKKVAANGEAIITSIIDGINCDADTKELIQQMASFCPDTRLSSEEALKRVKVLAKENASKRPHKTAVMTEELEVERYSDAKKARVAVLAKEHASKRPHKTAVMTEELEVERCSDAKKARFAEFTDQNERQGEQPLRYTFMTEESEVESCSGRKTAHLLVLAKENASKRPHKTAVMTEELEVERCSGAKKARVAEFTNQNEGRREKPSRYAFMTEESEIASCYGGKTAHLLELAKVKESKQPPQAAVMTKETAVESCSDQKKAHVSELAKAKESKQPPQAAVMTKEAAVESCPDPKKAHVSESPKGIEKILIQSPRDPPKVQNHHGNDIMKPPNDFPRHTEPGFSGDIDRDNRSKQENIPNFELINN